MPDGTMPGSPATGPRHGGSLLFWSLLAISSAWIYGAPYNTPGDPENGESEIIECPQCGDRARRQLNGLYLCRRHHNHLSKRRPDGSYGSADEAPDP
jgi:hypothetical protein